MSRTSYLAIVAVAVAAALLGVAAVRTSGEDPATTSAEGSAGTAPVSDVARACPTFGTNNAGAPTMSVGNLTLRTDDSAEGGSNKATLVPGGKAVADLGVKRRGAWASAGVDGKSTAVALNADGGLAPLSTAFAATRPDGDLGGGLAITQCQQTSSDMWFVGAGSTANRPGTLVLTNPTEVDAVVDVSMYGTREEVEVVGGSGIVVKSGKSTRIPLDKLGTGEDELAIQVRASRGTIAASVLDATGKLNSYSGSEYLPIAAQPSKSSVIGGVPTGSDERELLVANPGDRAANVSVTVAGKNGTSTQSGLESVSVDAGAVEPVDIPDGVGEAALSIRLKSNVPVTGAVRLTSGSDVAYAAANDGLKGPVAVPTGIGDALSSGDLSIAATPASPDKAATMQLRAFGADGQAVGKPANVEVAAGTTASFDPLNKVGVARGKTAYVTVQTSGAPVRATATYRDGEKMGVLPLVDLPATIVRPAVSATGAESASGPR